VCRHAVKAHDPLKGEELRSLLAQLHQCELPYTCPTAADNDPDQLPRTGEEIRQESMSVMRIFFLRFLL